MAGPLTGLVLAGGAARRLGGDKAGVRVGGASLLEHAVMAARAVCDECLLLPGPRELAVVGLATAPDDPRWPGPVGALAGGLSAARHDWCLLLACDQPFVEPIAVATLLDARQPGDRAVAYRDADGWQPFCGLYHRRLLTDLGTLDHGGSLRGLLEGLGARPVAVEGPAQRRALIDVDTPGDLLRARALAAGDAA